MKEEPLVTLEVAPRGDREGRTYRLSRRAARRLVALGVVCVLGVGVALASWTYLAARAWRAGELEREVAELRADRERVVDLAETLAEVEAGYERIRDLYGPESLPESGGAWLPPSAGRIGSTAVGAEAGGDGGEGGLGLPSAWPASERGFLSRPLVDQGNPDEHPGIDIAVPTGSYIRAAGAGRVVQAGEDPVYGLFLVLEHGDGYRSLYGHASRLLAEVDDRVRAGEVVGLTGSTGRSTAPHLHFEILRDGAPVDPLTLVQQP